MPKYLVFDLFKLFQSDDKTVSQYRPFSDIIIHDQNKMKKRVSSAIITAQYLSLLQRKRNIHIVMYCYENYESLATYYQEIMKGCLSNQTTLFMVNNIIICDSVNHKDVPSSHPMVAVLNGVKTFSYGIKLNNKNCLFQCLSFFLGNNTNNQVIILEENMEICDLINSKGWTGINFIGKNREEVFESILLDLPLEKHVLNTRFQEPPLYYSHYDDSEIIQDLPNAFFYSFIEISGIDRQQYLLQLWKAYRSEMTPVCVVGIDSPGKTTLISHFVRNLVLGNTVIWLDARDENFIHHQIQVYLSDRYPAARLKLNNIYNLFYERLWMLSKKRKIILIVENVHNKNIGVIGILELLKKEKNIYIILSSEKEFPEFHNIRISLLDNHETSELFNQFSNKNDIVQHKKCLENLTRGWPNALYQVLAIIDRTKYMNAAIIISIWEEFENKYPFMLTEALKVACKVIYLIFTLYESTPEIQQILFCMCILQATHVTRFFLENVLKKSLKNVLLQMSDFKIVTLDDTDKCTVVYICELYLAAANTLLKMFGNYAEWEQYLIFVLKNKKIQDLSQKLLPPRKAVFKNCFFQLKNITKWVCNKKSSFKIDCPLIKIKTGQVRFSEEKNFELNYPFLLLCLFLEKNKECEIVAIVEASKIIYGEKSLRHLISLFFCSCFSLTRSILNLQLKNIYLEIKNHYVEESPELEALRNLVEYFENQNNQKSRNYFTKMIESIYSNFDNLSLVSYISLLIFILLSHDKEELVLNLNFSLAVVKSKHQYPILKLYLLAINMLFESEINLWREIANCVQLDQIYNNEETIITFISTIFYLIHTKKEKLDENLLQYLNLIPKMISSFQDSKNMFVEFSYILLGDCYLYASKFEEYQNLLSGRQTSYGAIYGKNFILKVSYLIGCGFIYSEDGDSQSSSSVYMNALEILNENKKTYSLNFTFSVVYLKLYSLQIETKKNLIFAVEHALKLTHSLYAAHCEEILETVTNYFEFASPDWLDWTNRRLEYLKSKENSKYLDRLIEIGNSLANQHFNVHALKYLQDAKCFMAKNKMIDSNNILQILSKLSECFYYLGRVNEAIQTLNEIKMLDQQKCRFSEADYYYKLATYSEFYKPIDSLEWAEKGGQLQNQSNSDSIKWPLLRFRIMSRLGKIQEVKEYLPLIEEDVQEKCDIINFGIINYLVGNFEQAKLILQSNEQDAENSLVSEDSEGENQFNQNNFLKFFQMFNKNKILSKPGPLNFESDVICANIEIKNNNFGEAKKQLKEIKNKYKNYVENCPTIYIQFYIAKGLMLLKTSKFEKSKKYLIKSLNMAEEFFGNNSLVFANIGVYLGELYIQISDKQNAGTVLSASLQIYKKLLDKSSGEIYSIEKLQQQINLQAFEL